MYLQLILTIILYDSVLSLSYSSAIIPKDQYLGFEGHHKRITLNDINGSITMDFLSVIYDAERLTIENSFIDFIDPNSFRIMEDLESLTFKNNSKMPSITSETFNRSNDLERLSFIDNDKSLKFISTPCLNLRRLKSLAIISQDIESISATLLEKCKSLKKLDVINSGVRDIEERAFEDLEKLSHLNLMYNEISSINPGTFLNLKNLRTLNLAYNKLASLNFVELSGLVSLRRLNLMSNEINFVNFTLLPENARRVQFLILKQNPISCKDKINNSEIANNGRFTRVVFGLEELSECNV